MTRGKSKQGIFIFSIDTEMMWGPSERAEMDILRGRGKEDREAVDEILRILKKHDISATWAIVGHLFLDRCDPETCLTSKNMKAYHPEWYHDPYSDIEREPLRYGKDIVEKIHECSTPQEIGYHSFSHPIFTQITRAMAEDELAQAKRIEREWGLELRSFVFPQNQIAHVDLLPKYGFKIYRGRYVQRWNKDLGSVSKKINGGIDKLIASPVEGVWRECVWEVDGSMPFWDTQIPSSVPLKSKMGLNRAVASNKVFHIFIHPWSLLLYDRLKNDLDAFLGYVSIKRDEGKVDVMNMGEYSRYLGDRT